METKEHETLEYGTLESKIEKLENRIRLIESKLNHMVIVKRTSTPTKGKYLNSVCPHYYHTKTERDSLDDIYPHDDYTI